jgi:poly-gamma-glutamate synthesis protein (capsule biosynthesis protein)
VAPAPDRITLLAVGDVGVRRVEPSSMFARVAPILRTGDIVFGQLETVVTDRGARAPHAKLAMRAPSATARVIAEAGFTVMSAAGNHCLDWGDRGLADTLEHMAAADVRLCGAGATIAEARSPVIVERRGVRVAFLACSSILPDGYWADRRRPGCAPMRAHTLYEMIEPDQPGTPPSILTKAHAGDLDALCEDIRSARRSADIVIVSMHWGLHMIRAQIADYQREVARAAVRAGAGAVLGHHPHILKGVELIDRAPIIYSMGNFAIEQPQAFDPGVAETESFKHLMALNPASDPTALYMLAPETRMSVIVRLELDDRGVVETSLLPVWIDDTSTPAPLAGADPRFDEVAAYLVAVTREAGLSGRVVRDGDRLTLAPPDVSARTGS